MLRPNGMLVMTSDLGLDIQRHAFLPKAIHQQEMEREIRHHGCGEGFRSKVGAAAGRTGPAGRDS